MKSFDDELNDAIRKALHDSFENFEKKPGASIDQKIHDALDRPSRIRPLWLFAAATLLLLLGFGVTEMHERYTSFRAITHSQPTREEPKESATVVPLHGSILVNADQPTDQKKGSHTNPPKAPIRRPLKKAAPLKTTEILHAHAKPATGKVRHDAGLVFTAHNRPVPVMAHTGYALPAQKQESRIAHANPITIGEPAPLPVDLAMPEISSMKSAEDSVSNVPAHEAAREKLDLPRYQPPGKKSFAWLFNLTATNTFQSIYLLPNAESRILKVSFPVSTANLGYKFSAGFQTLGFQWLFHYSHLSWKAEYIYAIDEFKADEEGANRYVFERLGKAETVTSKAELAGIGIKKQFDFKGKRTGRFFAQMGLDYSRQLQSSGQDFVTGTISAGKVFAVNKTTDLVIGPYFEYNFNKVATAEYSIKVRPNQAGLSVGLRINRTR
jgi:hypothetical protein